jgi:response regulator RpfG family c-di-GMP phosphodiesterase
LILDDDVLIVRVVSRLLRTAGLAVEGTTDPEEALAMARHDDVHAVVSDLHMPDACGASFLATCAEVAPSAIRVLMSADPEFMPKTGSLADARVHALMNKSELTKLGSILVEQLRGRSADPERDEDREMLARCIARALSRPSHEDDANRDRVARWTSCVAEAMGCSSTEVETARLGAILHDVGQIAVRDQVFAPRRRLTQEEQDQLAAHPEAGARIVAEMPALREALPVIRAHHERQDGCGYPARLEGAAIPRPARAFQVVDAYDAMTHGRPYAPSRSHRDALDELFARAGEQHDRDAVSALDEIGEEGLADALVV